MVHVLTATICFITAVLSFNIAPPLNSKTNIHRTLTHYKPYSWKTFNLSLNPFSSAKCTGRSLLDRNVQYNTPSIPSINEPSWVKQSYLIDRSLFLREQPDFSASVDSLSDPFNVNERTATKWQSPGEL
ncbi:hypothetical protein JMJ35_008670 [Cladonia borealis]|uniref:Uncharacterized protein n=1 Tax=Cladonia borealis TaxID=184061 RepID=A0AA39QWN4_9LECA|nr:hypothetical protein JMJ35_008670 [Cladonia borealis]